MRSFIDGDTRLLAFLWLEGLFGDACGKPPSNTAYANACAMITEPVMLEVLKVSHKATQKGSGGLYKKMRVVIFDGTKITVQRSEENLEKYSPSRAGENEGHYPQIHAVCMYDLGTKSFMDVDLEQSFPSERESQRRLSLRWKGEIFLEVGDAGFSGVGNCQALRMQGHHALIRLKQEELKNMMLACKKRSMIVDVTLTKTHIANTPELESLVGTIIKLRLIRTEGTSKIRCMVLVTTLLDEKLHPWRELQNLYLGRVRIEFGFRHLKKYIRLEEIKKRTIIRTTQLIVAAMIAYNVAAILRNCHRTQSLMPEDDGTSLNCFEYAIECAMELLVAVANGRWKATRRLIKVISSYNSCRFKYKPWRMAPRIRRRPVSEFGCLSKSAKAAEKGKCVDLKEDMKELGRLYGQHKKN